MFDLLAAFASFCAMTIDLAPGGGRGNSSQTWREARVAKRAPQFPCPHFMRGCECGSLDKRDLVAALHSDEASWRLWRDTTALIRTEELRRSRVRKNGGIPS